VVERGDIMAAYFALRLENRKLNYNTVVQKFPQFKEDIDLILLADGYVVNDDGTVTLAQE
jgi:hypothetical protein